MKKTKSSPISFPASLVAPVGALLREQLTKLQSNKRKVDETDPFKSEVRVTDNAAVDTEAEEQFGHAMTSAMKRELDRRMIQTRRALARIKIGKYGICEVCGKMIDTDRLMIYPEATKCINCEKNKRKK